MSNSKSISKYFKEGDLITNLENLAASQGYVSAKKLHSQNNIINDYDDDEEKKESEYESKREDISDFLSNGNYYVPSYLTFLNDENKDHDHDKIENITITITPVEKCNPIDDELYNKLVESAELQDTSNNKKSSSSKNSKNKKTKKVLNKNNNSKKIKGGKKTKRKN